MLMKETGAHDKTFTVGVYLDGLRLGTGVGKSKKKPDRKRRRTL